MSFGTLAVICLVGILGPLLALPSAWHVPVVLGELLAGVLVGPTGAGWLHPGNEAFTFLADMGFALVMFVAGSHVPVRDPTVRQGVRIGVLRAAGVGALAAVLGFAVAAAFHTGHGALYAVLMASSSAALVLPIVDSLRLGGGPILQMLPQVAVADAACIVALPLAIDPSHAVRAALGALAVLTGGVAVFLALRQVERSGVRKRLHRVSEDRKFALELRVSLGILFAMAALATRTHVSIMLAGFSCGLAVAAVGEPRRLARQLFALTEGFLGPVFFVWLGSSLNLRALGSHPAAIALGLALGLGAVVAHTAMRLAGQPVPVGALASAQLGVPVAAVTIGTRLGVLGSGEPAAIVLAALVTIGVATWSGGALVRAGMVRPTHPPPAAQSPATGAGEA